MQLNQSPEQQDEIRRALKPNSSASSSEQQIMQKIPLAQAYKSASSNFYSIAGFSLINSLIAIFQGGLYFVVGLGITQVVDAFAYIIGRDIPEVKNIATVIGLVLDVSICGIVAIFGYLASKKFTWAIITGMVLYTIDTVLILVFKDWLGFAFHLFFLWSIFLNWRAIRIWNKNLPPPNDAFPLSPGFTK